MKILDIPQSGSVAGVTSSRNRYGQYRRTRAIPVNPNTARQLVVRGYLTEGSQAWRALTDEQRAGWNTLALSVTITDGLGQASNPSGFQLYTGCYARTKLVNQGPLIDPPANVPAITPAAITAAAAAAGAATFTVTHGATAAATALIIEASPPLSVGVNYCSDFRFMAMVAGGEVGAAKSIKAEWVAKFGALVQGQRIFVRTFSVSEDYGFAAGTAVRTVTVAA
jgi:hypothetical protein